MHVHWKRVVVKNSRRKILKRCDSVTLRVSSMNVSVYFRQEEEMTNLPSIRIT